MVGFSEWGWLATQYTTLDPPLRSARLKSPDRGRRTLDFNVRRLLGVNGSKLSKFRPSTENGLLFTIASASPMTVRTNSSLNCSSALWRREANKLRADRICLSQTPPIRLADGGFILNSNQSQFLSKRKLWIRAWSVSESVPVSLSSLKSPFGHQRKRKKFRWFWYALN